MRPLFVPLRRIIPVALLLAPLLAAAAVDRAGLRWETTELAATVRWNETGAALAFPFSNPGARTVRITNVVAGCGCTGAAASATEVAPGAAGEIRTQFDSARRSGIVRVPIDVSTDAGAEPVRLTLLVTIEDPVRLATKFLHWKAGEPRTPRRVKVEIADPAGITLSPAETSSPGYAGRLENDADPRVRWLEVTPPPAGTNGFGQISLRATLAGSGRVVNYSVLARAE